MPHRRLSLPALVVAVLALAGIATAAPASAADSTLTLTDCRTDVAGRTFTLAPGDSVTVEFSEPCVWGYPPRAPYSGFSWEDFPGTQNNGLPFYAPGGIYLGEVERTALPGQVTFTLTAAQVEGATNYPTYFTFNNVYHPFSFVVATERQEPEPIPAQGPPASHSFGVAQRDGACPDGWTTAGWEEWAQAPTCSLTTTYDEATQAWSNGTYAQVMAQLADWQRR